MISPSKFGWSDDNDLTSRCIERVDNYRLLTHDIDAFWVWAGKWWSGIYQL